MAQLGKVEVELVPDTTEVVKALEVLAQAFEVWSQAMLHMGAQARTAADKLKRTIDE